MQSILLMLGNPPTKRARSEVELLLKTQKALHEDVEPIPMTSLPNPCLPLDTVEQMFEKLKWEEARLKESWSVYDSFNFLVTVHHLWFDWLGHAGSTEQQARVSGLPHDAKVVFQAVVDVLNGNKHWLMERPGSKKRQVVAEVAEPMCAGWDSYFFGDMVHFKFGEYSSACPKFPPWSWAISNGSYTATGQSLSMSFAPH